jgi:hypothetical protein
MGPEGPIGQRFPRGKIGLPPKRETGLSLSFVVVFVFRNRNVPGSSGGGDRWSSRRDSTGVPVRGFVPKRST